MKTQPKNTSKQKWTSPEGALSQEEFGKGIKAAEEGPFYTIEESKKLLEEWRKQKNSK